MKRRFLYIVLIIICFFQNAKSQNLVKNGSFEDTSSCPINSGDLFKANYWLQIATPDLLHSCNSGALSVPSNFMGNQFAFHGESYAFFVTYFAITLDYREYVIASLSKPLESKEYYVEFYVNSPETMNATVDEIGVYLSSQSNASSSPELLSVTPNMESLTGEFFNDTTWTKINSCFEANGNEQFMIIGNFKSDANSNIQIIGGTNDGAGLYIDMIQLYEIPTFKTLNLQSICQSGDSIFLDIADTSEVVTYQWSPTIGVSNPTSPKSWVNPTQSTTYTITQTTPCGSYQTTVGVIVSQDYCDYLGGYEEFQLYPNPNNGTFAIDYTLGEGANNILYIYNSIGQIVKTMELQGGFQQTQTVELPQLSAGLYTYKLWVNGNALQTEKMVVVE